VSAKEAKISGEMGCNGEIDLVYDGFLLTHVD